MVKYRQALLQKQAVGPPEHFTQQQWGQRFLAPVLLQKGVTRMYVTYQALQVMIEFGMLIVAIVGLCQAKKK